MEDDLSVGEANDLAREILLRGEFVGARDPGFFSRSVNWVIDRIGDLLTRIFETLFSVGGGGAGSFVAFVLLAIVAAILVFAIVQAIRFGRANRADDVEPSARIVFDEVVDPDELRSELAAARSAGSWREAVVAGFRLSILALIEAKIAFERPGATTGDFGRAVASNKPDLSGDYQPAARVFERAFYSDDVIGAADFDAVQLLLDRLDRVPSR